MPQRSSAVSLSAAVAAAVVLALSGCGLLSQATDALQGKADVFSLVVGDCTNDEAVEATEVTSVAKPSCDEVHDNEVYLAFEVGAASYPAGADYPGDDALFAEAEDGCFQAFEEWVGASNDDTSLYFGTYYPSPESWDDGDREVLCLAYDSNGPVTGTLKGKGSEYPY